ncbi:hypothetical protein PS15m_003784 [Mucor circinelloides]
MDLNQLIQTVQDQQQQLTSLVERVQHHDNLLARLDILEKENQALKKILQDKDLVIEKLQRSHDSAPKDTHHEGGSKSTPQATSTTTATAPNSFSAIAKKSAHRPDPAQATKRKLAAGRLFKSSAAKGPQGYEYIYIGRSGKILRSEVRRTLRKIGVDTARVLDINFPASEVIGILLHTQYVDEVLSLLRASEAEIYQDFDPMDSDNIADPKYDDLSREKRAGLVAELVHDRAVDALRHIRPLNVSSVGHWFMELYWIDQVELDAAIANAMDRLKEKDPKKADFLFKRRRATPEGESSGTSKGSAMELN